MLVQFKKTEGVGASCVGAVQKDFLSTGTGVIAVGRTKKVAVVGMGTVKVKVKPANVIQYFLQPK